MSTTTKNETEISAAKEIPTITITREFDAPPDLVFRAFADPELLPQWIGPHDIATEIKTFDCRRGGEWAYDNTRIGDDSERYSFYGSFHEVVENEKIVQTFTFEGFPEAVSLETMTFETLPDGRTRTVGVSLFNSFEARDGMLSSGMDTGVNDGFEKLDALLAKQGK